MNDPTDWRPVVKSIFVRIFTQVRDEAGSQMDDETRLSQALTQAQATISLLPQAVKGIKPLADENLLEEARVIMIEAGCEVFGPEFDRTPRLPES